MSSKLLQECSELVIPQKIARKNAAQIRKLHTKLGDEQNLSDLIWDAQTPAQSELVPMLQHHVESGGAMAGKIRSIFEPKTQESKTQESEKAEAVTEVDTGKSASPSKEISVNEIFSRLKSADAPTVPDAVPVEHTDSAPDTSSADCEAANTVDAHASDSDTSVAEEQLAAAKSTPAQDSSNSEKSALPDSTSYEYDAAVVQITPEPLPKKKRGGGRTKQEKLQAAAVASQASADKTVDSADDYAPNPTAAENLGDTVVAPADTLETAEGAQAGVVANKAKSTKQAKAEPAVQVAEYETQARFQTNDDATDSADAMAEDAGVLEVDDELVLHSLDMDDIPFDDEDGDSELGVEADNAEQAANSVAEDEQAAAVTSEQLAAAMVAQAEVTQTTEATDATKTTEDASVGTANSSSGTAKKRRKSSSGKAVKAVKVTEIAEETDTAELARLDEEASAVADTADVTTGDEALLTSETEDQETLSPRQIAQRDAEVKGRRLAALGEDEAGAAGAADTHAHPPLRFGEGKQPQYLPLELFDIRNIRITGLTTGQIAELLANLTPEGLPKIMPQRIIIHHGAYLDSYSDLRQFEIEFCYEPEHEWFTKENERRQALRRRLRGQANGTDATVKQQSVDLEYQSDGELPEDFDGEV